MVLRRYMLCTASRLSHAKRAVICPAVLKCQGIVSLLSRIHVCQQLCLTHQPIRRMQYVSVDVMLAQCFQGPLNGLG